MTCEGHIRLNVMHIQLALLLMLALIKVGVFAADTALPGCKDTCGNVTIPFPFGVGKSKLTDENCFLEERLKLFCLNNSLYIYNYIIIMQIININLEGQLDMLFYISKLCNDSKGEVANRPFLGIPAFTISSKENKFISVGCDTYGYLNSYRNGVTYSTGCLTRCGKFPDKAMTKETCSGIGCCQVDIPPEMSNITLQTYSFGSLNVSSCSYSFVAKQGFYNFNINHLDNLPFDMIPMVVDWTVGDERCEDFLNGSLKSVCMSNSNCDDVGTSSGYRCTCKEGYHGNPYHPNGCQGASVGFIALLLTSWLYIVYQKRNLIKQRERFFRKNGGLILQQRLSAKQDSSRIAQIFKAEELKKATNNYDEGLIIGRGGFGTVFKGILADNKFVAIKKSKVVDQNQVEQFINEVIILSQINHRNVVKLLGCCLDVEVPLLVYEFVNNGNLYNHLHNESKARNMPWKIRLGIAIEVAGALSYLHSDACITIIHRDVKSANILLDDAYISKVSDFGASRLLPFDQVELATLVQGTFGHLDPEYMQTSRLTEKSDVYSFGVVLVELLTGQKALSFQRPEEETSLAMHFLSSLRYDRLFEILEYTLLKDENKKQIIEVAVLASRCLSLKGDERPTMKEVEMELKRIRLKKKHSWNNVNQVNLEESQYLPHETSSNYEYGNSSIIGNYRNDSLSKHAKIAFNVAH